MASLISRRHRLLARPLAVACVLAASALAGCTGNTYGTGTSPGMQTLQDITGVAGLSPKDKEPINYTPRPKIVAPPTVGALPPPVVDNPTQTAANWPNDPDLLRAKVKADAETRAATGSPQLQLPKARTVDGGYQPVDAGLTKEQIEEVRKQMAAVKGRMAVDENGNPVRKYLTDPPNDYRLPDPNAPIAVAEVKKKKKFKWWWQQD